MAKTNSKKTKSSAGEGKPKKPKQLSRAALVAAVAGISNTADVNVVFKSGLGQITAALFRKGVLINMQSISHSGKINFSDVQTGDSISINGICSGTADITVSVPTNPVTPEHFNPGIIMTGYTIL